MTATIRTHAMTTPAIAPLLKGGGGFSLGAVELLGKLVVPEELGLGFGKLVVLEELCLI